MTGTESAAFRRWSAACLVLLAAFAAADAQETPQAQQPQSSYQNLQQIIERAKAEIFPALVYVKPIVEDYDRGEKRMRKVFGSGVIISPDGLVVTNHHVVDKAIKVNCVLHDRDQVPATILGRDADSDLALLKLEVGPEKLPLPCGRFGDSDTMEEGDFVMALGSPFGFTRSISLGILSNTRRYLGFETEHQYNLWLQTDAAINPGNSGGPLVDTNGGIVGINTLGVFLSDNIGFAIPSKVVRRVVDELKEHGEVKRAWCGLKLQPLRDFHTDTFTEGEEGVLVADVEPVSPASDAGIKKGDVLLSVDGRTLDGVFAENLPDVSTCLAALAVDVAHDVLLLRGGQTVACSITPVLKGKVEGDTFDCRRWNMTVKEINRHEEPDLFFYRQEGVYVYAVRRPGNASDAELHEKDILTRVDSRPVDSLQQLQEVYEGVVGDDSRDKKVLIEVLRSGYKKWLTLEYIKDYDEEG